jgi:hypothetical protein
MKLQAKKTKIDKLIFQWDHKASNPSEIRKIDAKHNKQLSIDRYFDLLSEIKPHKQELNETKIFGIPFTLPQDMQKRV